ncbi:MAG: ABC transporter ATP-binding protein [Deltaproteobacteria bacterium]|nr:ABC transporter ATP-binding protein [Deltaproteobacteria bacterium]
MVCKYYGTFDNFNTWTLHERWAVKDLNLEVYRGDVFGFLGPNGAGKSTTIRMLLGLVRPTSGKTEIFGYSVSKSRKKALENVCGLVEQPDFYLHLSAKKNLEILGILSGGIGKDRVAEVLQLFGLYGVANDKVKAFSHGMKQRLGIAQTLLSDPELIILDEPTSGLDPQGMKEVRELIVGLSKEQGITIFLSSHLLHEIEQIATRMAIIHQGRLIVQGKVKTLLENFKENVVILRASPVKDAADLLRRQDWVSSLSINNDKIEIKLDSNSIPKMNALLVENQISVSAIIPKRSLEDYFLSITRNV